MYRYNIDINPGTTRALEIRSVVQSAHEVETLTFYTRIDESGKSKISECCISRAREQRLFVVL